MKRITLAQAENLQSLADDVENALSEVMDALTELTAPDVKGDDREEQTSMFADAVHELVTAAEAVGFQVARR